MSNSQFEQRPQRPMNAQELVAAGYPSNFHVLPREVQNEIEQQRILSMPQTRPVGGPAQQFPSPTAFHQQVPASQHVGARGPQFVYNREQKGHSLILHLLLGGFVLWIPAIYFTVSPNHYWHA